MDSTPTYTKQNSQSETDTSTTGEIIISTHNICSASKHYAGLRDMGAILKPDVICLQEVFGHSYKGKIKLFLKGYETVFDTKFENNKSHIIATLFNKKTVNYKQLEVEERKSPMQAFTIKKGECTEEFLIINTYAPNGKKYDYETLSTQMQKHDNAIICGDFNSTLIGERKRPRDLELRTFVEGENLFNTNTQNIPTYTYVHAKSQGKSTIDHILVSEGIEEHGYEFETLEQFAQGEQNFHFPLSLRVKITEESKKKMVQDFRKLNINEYQQLLKTNLEKPKYKKTSTLTTKEDIVIEMKKLSDCVMETVDELIPPKELKEQQDFKPSPKLDRLMKAKKRAYRQHLKTKDAVISAIMKKVANKLATKVRELTEEEREAHKKNTYNRVSELPITSSEFWKATNRLTGIKKTSSTNKALKYNNQYAISSKEKANVHLAYQQTVFQEHKINTPETTKYYEEVVKPAIKWIEEKETEPFEIIDITEDEIKKALKTTNAHKAPGSDRMKAFCLKEATRPFLERMRNLFNACLKLRFQPDEWKEAILILIPKPNKDHTDPSGYRPISLLCCMGKLFDKIICSRTRASAEAAKREDNTPFLPFDQAGFRELMQCLDQLFRMNQDQIRALEMNENLIALAFDGSKAFDRASHEILMVPLVYLVKSGQMDIYLLFYFREFLRKRSYRVREGTHITEEQGILKAGVPQGSCSAPLLYIMFIADMPTAKYKWNEQSITVPKETRVGFKNMGTIRKLNRLKFADDLAISMSFPTNTQQIHVKKACTIVLQTFLDDLLKWANERKVKFNADKTQLICFKGSNSNWKKGTKPTLVFQGEILKYTPTFKYLGITFDEGCKFNTQTKETITECKKRIRRIAGLVYKGDLHPKTADCLNKSLVFSLVAYRGITFFNDESKHEKYQHVSNLGRRGAMQALYTGISNTSLSCRMPTFDIVEWTTDIIKRWWLKKVGPKKYRKGKPKNNNILQAIKDSKAWGHRKKKTSFKTPYDKLVELTGITGLEEEEETEDEESEDEEEAEERVANETVEQNNTGKTIPSSILGMQIEDFRRELEEALLSTNQEEEEERKTEGCAP